MNGKKLILLVEDEAAAAVFVEKILTRQGYEIIGVSDNCADALRMANDKMPDLALVDYHLNDDLTGATVARQLTAHSTLTAFMTSNPDAAAEEASDLSCKCLEKPFTVEELTRFVKVLLEDIKR